MSTEQDSEAMYSEMRRRMVATQLEKRGINDPKILAAFRNVARHVFVESRYREMAYDDSPLPIGYNQTISQPFIVAYMTAQLRLSSTDSVLEIGTGSGYQTAILAGLAARVYTIEIIDELVNTARQNLNKLGYDNISVKVGDGYEGWAENGPFDAIMLTAAPPKTVPQPLLGQLKVGGRLIAPAGREFQQLILYQKGREKMVSRTLLAVRFVPMVGKTQENARSGPDHK